MELTELIIAGLGLAWASGLNLYAALATIGILGATGQMNLPPDLEILGHPLVIAASVFMYLVEFVADKVPGVDTTWDTIHTFIRIPAGAVLALGAIGDVSPAVQVAALIIGGSVAATSHAFKAGTRVLINTSPEPFSNWGASLLEDGLVIGGVTLAILQPTAFLVLFVLFLGLVIWLMPKIWRGIKLLWTRINSLFGRKQSNADMTISLKSAGGAAGGHTGWPYSENGDQRPRLP
ncbi:MAG: DUF4126 domain-containing protein [Rhodospirillaceae bacterium]|jgi:hypothetical protein|nr:DUF4126 domain-containing protein [Rhodospirillaceae bacterium]